MHYLREYQQEALRAILKHVTLGERRGLIVLPTGSGKTVIIAHLPQVLQMKPGERMMVIVHRDELVAQTADKFRRYAPHLTVGIEKAQSEAGPLCDIVIASVQTLGRNPSDGNGGYRFNERLRRFDPQQFRIICIDEAHHAVASSYKGILAYFGLLKGIEDWNKRSILLGVTATPSRADNIGLSSVFDRIFYQRQIFEMISDGWLCDMKAYRVHTKISLDGVRIHAGDFAVRELERTVNTPLRNQIIVEKYKELGEGMQALAFTVDVQHSLDLCNAFLAHNIPAAAIHGKMPLNERRQTLQRFKRGELRVLTSCAVLSEGFDEPQAAVAIMARPTKSGLLYRQQIGRVLRPYPSPEEQKKHTGWVKPYAIIIDVCDVSSRHSLITAPTLFGLPPKLDMAGERATAAIRKIERATRNSRIPLSLNSITSLADIDSLAESVNLLAPPTIDPKIAAISNMNWLKSGEDKYYLTLPKSGILHVELNMIDLWELRESHNGIIRVIDSFKTLKEAIRAAENRIPRDQLILLSRKSNWRNKPPTDQQLGLLWKIDPAAKKTFHNFDDYKKAALTIYPTCGYASDRISMLLRFKKADAPIQEAGTEPATMGTTSR